MNRLSDGGAVALVARASYDHAAPLPVEIDVRVWMAFRRRFFAEVVAPNDVDGSPVVAVAALFATETWEFTIDNAGQVCEWSLAIPSDQAGPDVQLGVRCADGRRFLVSDPSARVVARSSFDTPRLTFVRELEKLSNGLVVEIGSRDLSGRTHTWLVPDHLDYLGVDIREGPNVDVVGDAHELSSLVAPGSADAVFSIATFEHLAMPWKCAVEINRVLKPGGTCFILSHQTFPLHETPWDFFRFSDSAWHSLFNEATGFEIIDVAMGEAAAVAGLGMTPITWNMDQALAYLGSVVTCRKVGDAVVDWPVALDKVANSMYPH